MLANGGTGLFSVAVVGTAKNTGKTTTLISLLELAAGKKMTVGLTSIGYDGEDLDNLTGLPKPRVSCPAGVLVATAARCLEAGKAAIDDLSPSGRLTPLGEVFIGRVVRPGTVVLAGPNETVGLSEVLSSFARAGADFALVDGAFGRIAPASAADGLVLATGAAKTADLRVLVEETKAIERVFAIPVSSRGQPSVIQDETVDLPASPSALEGPHRSERTSGGTAEGSTVVEGMLLVPEHAPSLAGMIGESTRRVHVWGAVDPHALGLFAEILGNVTGRLEVVFLDAIKLLVSGKPREMSLALRRLEERGVEARYLREIPLCAVTLNPFYPRPANGAFEAEALDAGMMKASFARVLGCPVFDVLRDGAAGLLEAILKIRRSEGLSPAMENIRSRRLGGA